MFSFASNLTAWANSIKIPSEDSRNDEMMVRSLTVNDSIRSKCSLSANAVMNGLEVQKDLELDLGGIPHTWFETSKIKGFIQDSLIMDTVIQLF